jgi:hypothetical protein
MQMAADGLHMVLEDMGKALFPFHCVMLLLVAR